MKKLLSIFLFIATIIFIYIYDINQVGEKQSNNVVAKPLEIKLSKNELKQGEYLKITFNNVYNKDLKIESNIGEVVNNEVYYYSDKAYAFLPVSIYKTNGLYDLKVYNNNVLIKEYKIEIIEGNFEVQNLYISETVVSESTSNEAHKQYLLAMKEAKSYSYKRRFYESTFIMPTEGRITTEFGIKRYINNNPIPTRHFGIDIANEINTPIKAVASGVVTYAGFFPSGGNYIVIDHGMGLLSHYGHLNNIVIKKLQIIKQGQIIGYMGSTGFSTGSHLHFAMTLKEIYINPWEFIKKED